MAEAKTRPTAVSVEEFIAAVEDPRRREDAAAVVALLTRATGLAPTMWGPSIVGFGRYHYRYDSGHEGDAPLVGFAPRKANLVFYTAADEDARADVLNRLGKHRTGKGCVYVNRLSDIDPDVLAEMALGSIRTLQARYPA